MISVIKIIIVLLRVEKKVLSGLVLLFIFFNIILNIIENIVKLRMFIFLVGLVVIFVNIVLELGYIFWDMVVILIVLFIMII